MAGAELTVHRGGREQEPQHLRQFREFVFEQCAKLAEQILAQSARMLAEREYLASAARPSCAAPATIMQRCRTESTTTTAAELAERRPGTGHSSEASTDVVEGAPSKEMAPPPGKARPAPLQLGVLPMEDGPPSAVSVKLSSPSRRKWSKDESVTTGCSDMPSSETPTPGSRRSEASLVQPRRVVMFMDMSPDCDDECAFLFLLSDLNHKNVIATIELVMADSHVRLRWMEHLFRDKFTAKGTWKLREGGDGFQVGTVAVNFYVLHSPQREQMAIKEFWAKLPSLDLLSRCNIIGRPYELVPAGIVDVVLVAAPIPDLDPSFFDRFAFARATYVVGTPGGMNCQQPSWSRLLWSLNKLGPLIYLAPQFTRMVRLPKSYVKDNPHWTPYMKKKVFDMALTCMARRPEIPAAFGDWGLVLRLNAANARLCATWFQNVMRTPIRDADDCPAYIRSIVQAYVDRNSGNERKLGSVVNELKQLGIDASAAVDSQGQPLTQEARAQIREAYRKALFRHVYACVTTTETILFQNEANFRPNAGAGEFRTLNPRCGYTDPLRDLSALYGADHAIAIVSDLPIESLTPAYDMVGAMFTARFLETGSLEGLGVQVQAAEASMGAALLPECAEPENDILVVGEQSQAVVETVVGMLQWEVEHDPLLVVDRFWAEWRDTTGKVGGACHDMAEELSTMCLRSVHSEGAGSKGFDCLVIHPASVWSLPWAVCTLTCIAYDFITVPLQVFDVGQIDVIMWLTTVFWTVDSIRCFLVGYYQHGSIELRLQKTARNYFTGWFAADFLLVGCDWTFVLLQQVLGFNSRVVTSMRVLRSVRSIRLLKLSRLPALGQSLSEAFHSPMVVGAFKTCIMIFLIFATTHLVACGWYFLACPLAVHDSDRTWVTASQLDLQDKSMLYVTCIHWALAHLLLGEMDIAPQTVYERCYSVAIDFLGLVVFSSFVSGLTEFTSQVAETRAEKRRQDESVRRYFERHSVSVQLASQIQNFREHAMHMSETRVQRHEIEGLRNLPESLAAKLSVEVYGPKLREHSFFVAYGKRDPTRLNDAASALICEEGFLPNGDVFLKGQDVASVFIVIAGELEYTSGPRQSSPVRVTAGQWVSEAALWLIWKRRGTLQSVSRACLLNLNIAAFRGWATGEVHGGLFAAKYAELYARSLLHGDKPITELSDLHMDKEAWSEVAEHAGELTDYLGSMAGTS